MAGPEDRLIKEALMSMQQQPQETMVSVRTPDGGEQQMPASIALLHTVNELLSVMRQMLIGVSAMHLHLASRAHPKSREAQACPICAAQQRQDANVVAGGVRVGSATQVEGMGQAEEEGATES